MHLLIKHQSLRFQPPFHAIASNISRVPKTDLIKKHVRSCTNVDKKRRSIKVMGIKTKPLCDAFVFLCQVPLPMNGQRFHVSVVMNLA